VTTNSTLGLNFATQSTDTGKPVSPSYKGIVSSSNTVSGTEPSTVSNRILDWNGLGSTLKYYDYNASSYTTGLPALASTSLMVASVTLRSAP
jgi:saccharopine dehydrogenase-like NADP-dependent oxidoreductase